MVVNWMNGSVVEKSIVLHLHTGDDLSLCVWIHMYACINIHVHLHTYMCVWVCVYKDILLRTVNWLNVLICFVYNDIYIITWLYKSILLGMCWACIHVDHIPSIEPAITSREHVYYMYQHIMYTSMCLHMLHNIIYIYIHIYIYIYDSRVETTIIWNRFKGNSSITIIIWNKFKWTW